MSTERAPRAPDLPDPTLNLELYFCVEVLQLESLHYGYWDEPELVFPERLDLDDVRCAQMRYTNTLLDFMPRYVDAILDVGCGVGDVARALVRSGRQVTAISPDRHHARFFPDAGNGRLRFHNQTFEAFRGNAHSHDLVLFSESQNYIAQKDAFLQAHRHLRPGGYILVSGMFRQRNSSAFTVDYVEEEYVAAAAAFGFRLVRRVDITRHILPTLEYGRIVWQRYVMPALSIMNDHLANGKSLKRRALRWLLASERRRLDRVRQYYEQRLNPTLFREHMAYVRLLFEGP